MLIYGRDELAIEAGKLLKDHLDVTVLITPPADSTPPRATEFPVVKGTIRAAKGILARSNSPSTTMRRRAILARRALFGAGARRRGVALRHRARPLRRAPLFPAHDLRDGYLRADPADPAAVLSAVLKARDLVGTFDKPRYIDFTAELCAHSRSQHRRLPALPRPLPDRRDRAGRRSRRDRRAICAGCGQCAAVCPTGAAAYALPPAERCCASCVRCSLPTTQPAESARSCCCTTARTARR